MTEVDTFNGDPYLDAVRVVPVGTSGQTTGCGRAVAVSVGSVSGGGAALGCVVHASGSALVFALSGARLSDGTATSIGRGLGAAGGVGRILLNAVVGRRGHTGHITGRCLQVMVKNNFSLES